MDFTQAGLQFDDRFALFPHIDNFGALSHSGHSPELDTLLIEEDAPFFAAFIFKLGQIFDHCVDVEALHALILLQQALHLPNLLIKHGEELGRLLDLHGLFAEQALRLLKLRPQRVDLHLHLALRRVPQRRIVRKSGSFVRIVAQRGGSLHAAFLLIVARHGRHGLRVEQVLLGGQRLVCVVGHEAVLHRHRLRLLILISDLKFCFRWLVDHPGLHFARFFLLALPLFLALLVDGGVGTG